MPMLSNQYPSDACRSNSVNSFTSFMLECVHTFDYYFSVIFLESSPYRSGSHAWCTIRLLVHRLLSPLRRLVCTQLMGQGDVISEETKGIIIL